jgi:hypothetical protein
MDFVVSFKVNADNLGKMLDYLDDCKQVKEICGIQVIRRDKPEPEPQKLSYKPPIHKSPSHHEQAGPNRPYVGIYEVIAKLLREHETATPDMVRLAVESAGFSAASWKSAITKAIRDGKVKRTGYRRSARYQLAA